MTDTSHIKFNFAKPNKPIVSGGGTDLVIKNNDTLVDAKDELRKLIKSTRSVAEKPLPDTLVDCDDLFIDISGRVGEYEFTLTVNKVATD